MARRRLTKKKKLVPDPKYNHLLINMFVTRLMKQGKKTLAYKIFYQSLEKIKNLTHQDSLFLFEQAIKNVTPSLEVKSKRIGGSLYQIPINVEEKRGQVLAIRWILNSSKKRTGKNMVLKITNEIIDASKNMGNSIRKKDEIQKMAEANKAFLKRRF